MSTFIYSDISRFNSLS